MDRATEDVLNKVAYQEQRWGSDHDDKVETDGQLVDAAVVFCVPSDFPHYWPWDTCEFRDRGNRENLVNAAALIISEIKRLDRKEDRR